MIAQSRLRWLGPDMDKHLVLDVVIAELSREFRPSFASAHHLKRKKLIGGCLGVASSTGLPRWNTTVSVRCLPSQIRPGV